MNSLIIRIVLYITLLNVSCYYLISKNDLLQSGPMLGYSEHREVAIWVQTKIKSKVNIVYFNQTKPTEKFTTKEIETDDSFGNVATLICDKVFSDNKYNYELFINGEKQEFNYPLEFQSQSLWLFRKDPPNIKFAVGSCFFINDSLTDRPGTKYGSGYEIIDQIYKQKPNFMLWLGDNVYTNETDYGTKSGFIYRYTHTRSLPELQPLLASTHHYATWDDHDYGANDSDGSFLLKETSREVFQKYWANNSYGFNGKGIYSSFIWGDVEFFLLDDRFFRDANYRKTGRKDYFGETQINWLINKLVSSRATFKIICTGGQLLNPYQKFENYSNYKEEQTLFLDLLQKEKIDGLFILDGDRHFTELTKLERENSYPLYDLTVSSLTAGANPKGCEEPNTQRVEGTCVGEHNFAIIEVAGKFKARELIFKLISEKGKIFWEKKFNESEFKNKK